MLLLFSVTLTTGQIFKTSLKITVRDELGNTVDSASVKLFERKEDYTKEVNVAFEGLTDAKGVVKFKDLKPISYFIIVRKKDKNNYGGGEEVGVLEKGKFNKTTVIIQ